MALEFPIIYLLPTHIGPDELLELEGQIPTLTHDISEAQIILGKLSHKRRAEFELRCRKLTTQEIPIESDTGPSDLNAPPTPKRRKTDGSGAFQVDDRADGGVVKVARLAWLTESLSKNFVLPLDGFLLYQGRKVGSTTSTGGSSRAPVQTIRRVQSSIHGQSSGSKITAATTSLPTTSHEIPPKAPKRPSLLKETTSEHDVLQNLPPVPDYLHTIYSCQRPTPYNSPNAPFIAQLKEIRTLRALSNDEVGVRAYSTSIATLSAYPYKLSTAAGENTA